MSIPDTLTLSIEEHSPYHYRPNRGAVFTFVILFSISTCLHLGQLVRYRMWWILPTIVLCGVMEILGWSARLWSSFSPFAMTPFQVQITCTVLGPTPLLAASFVIFGGIIQRLGLQYSRLGARWYTIMFCGADVISLFVQGIGGGGAASATSLEGANNGGRIMLGGIIFQMIVVLLFAVCMAEFYYRHSKDLPLSPNEILGGKNQKAVGLKVGQLTSGLFSLGVALAFGTFVLFVRSIYRIVELSGGWDGPIMRDEVLFNILDGAMVILAIFVFNFFHPGRLLPPLEKDYSHVNGDVDLGLVELASR